MIFLHYIPKFTISRFIISRFECNYKYSYFNCLLKLTNFFQIIRLGSGMTWGTSKYKMKGVHEIARDNSRVVVSGHAAEVGIVGWSMGGGHSPLGPLHGLGVDQMLEVELVGADGSYIIANEEGTSVKSAGSITF